MSPLVEGRDTASEDFRSPVLLHGFAGTGESWPAPILDGLASMRRTPVRVDLPGHGRWRRAEPALAVDLPGALSAIADAGEWPAEVIGYSMGGRLALHFAAAFPDRVSALVLESASPGLATPAERESRSASDEVLATRIEDRGVDDFIDHWASLPLFESRARLPGSVLGRLRAVQRGNSAAGLAAALRGLGTGALPSLWEGLPGIEVPTLLITGALDHKFVRIAERMAERLPEARHVVIPEAGHTVHLERPAAWLRAVSEFLGDGQVR